MIFTLSFPEWRFILMSIGESLVWLSVRSWPVPYTAKG